MHIIYKHIYIAVFKIQETFCSYIPRSRKDVYMSLGSHIFQLSANNTWNVVKQVVVEKLALKQSNIILKALKLEITLRRIHFFLMN